jgi:FtsP/CotA-like multicopper oxidase with cupredoxin domain
MGVLIWSCVSFLFLAMLVALHCLSFLCLTNYYFQLSSSLELDLHVGVDEVMYAGKIFPAITSTTGLKLGKPIHVTRGEVLSVRVTSDTSVRDVSIHWHGFEMKGKQAYDGVVGVTQCAIRPKQSYLYNFTVDENPGTYWYHTHSGLASGQWHEFIAGPLIVHPSNTPPPTETETSPLSYGNERILFIQDMLKLEPNVGMQNAVGGLSGAITRGRTGDIVGTHPWWGGIINGGENESEETIVAVEPNTPYLFRVINGGAVFAMNFSIPGIQLKVLASDGKDFPCDPPLVVDSIILWTAERYDVEVTFPAELTGTTIRYTARTMESAENGYDHYVNGLIRVGSGAPLTATTPIPSSAKYPHHPTVLNCYRGQLSTGTCIPFAEISSLTSSFCKRPDTTSASEEEEDPNAAIDSENTVIHFVDFLFNPPPQYSHMVSLDGQPFTQHVNPYYPPIASSPPSSLYPYDLHPSSVLLDLELGKTVIIVMRTSSLMQHPMHFHGHKFEVLDQYTHPYYEDCSIFNCPLTTKYNSKEEMHRLKHMPYTGVLKDTTVIPAGGAVVIRYPVNNPGYWLVHCHIGPHKDDGMTFIIHESTKNNTASPWYPQEVVSIPSDYPICLPKSTQDIPPSCACYHDPDQLTSLRLDSTFICSRDWICHHDPSYNTQLKTFVPMEKPGIGMHKLSPDTSVVLSVIFTLVACGIVSLYCYKSFVLAARQDMMNAMTPPTGAGSGAAETTHTNMASFTEKYALLRMVMGTEDTTPFLTEFMAEWEVTYRDMINPMRLIEVGGLAVLTGIVFFEVGEKHTNRGLRECVSLFFFSVTLWTFTRMYPAIPAHHGWRERLCKRLVNQETLSQYLANGNQNSSSPTPLPTPFQLISWRQILKLTCVRHLVYLCAEGWWPCVFGLITYPMAHVNGKVNIWFQVIALIIMNNLCYISFGAVIGTIVPVVQVAMISSTLYSQMSLVCAGFYTTLPLWLSWFRYVSYVFYTYSGIVKGVYRSTDSYECFFGDSRVGQDWCLLETAGVIEDMKIRGINTADSGDPNSSDVSLSFGMLIFYYFFNGFLLFLALLYHMWKRTKVLIEAEEARVAAEIEGEGNGMTPFEIEK